LAISRRPAPVISNTPISSVGTEAVLDRAQDAELVRAFALEGEHRIDHVLDHARTGDLAVLGDMADQDHGRARALGEADQRLRARAHLRHRAGRGLDRVGPHGLDGVDDDEAWRFALGQRRHDILDRGLGRQLDLGAGKPEPLGAQPHLRHRLLARNIDRAVAGLGERGRNLDQERRFADAGVAAEEQHRAAHEAAAGDAVELGKPRCEPRRLLSGAGERLGARTRAPCAARDRAFAAGRSLRFPRRWCSIHRRRPHLALPAAVVRAAVLADETRFATGHCSDYRSFLARVLRLRMARRMQTKSALRRPGLRLTRLYRRDDSAVRGW
jgi:hypothetical protein